MKYRLEDFSQYHSKFFENILACQEGDYKSDLLDTSIKKIKEWEMIEDLRDKQIFIRDNKIIFDYIDSPFFDNFMKIGISSKTRITITYAFKNGYLPLVQWLIKKFPYNGYSTFKAKNYYAFRLACRHGHLPLVQWLIKKFPNDDYKAFRTCNYHAFREAYENKHHSLTRWLIDRFPDDAHNINFIVKNYI